MKGYVYLLKNIDNHEICYIGSTTNKLTQRYSQHKYECNTGYRDHYFYKVYKNIRATGGIQKYSIEPLEEFEFDTRKELVEKEKQYIKHLKPPLNSVIYKQTELIV